MDLGADPRVDFYRFAAGGWLDRIERPEQLPSWTFPAIQIERIKKQMKDVLAQAEAKAPSAPKGSPAQRVGDFYISYMDVERRDAAGLPPIQGDLDRITAIASFDDLVRYAAHFQKTSWGIVPAEIRCSGRPHRLE